MRVNYRANTLKALKYAFFFWKEKRKEFLKTWKNLPTNSSTETHIMKLREKITMRNFFFNFDFSIIVYFQCYFVLISGIEHGGQTVTPFTKRLPQRSQCPRGTSTLITCDRPCPRAARHVPASGSWPSGCASHSLCLFHPAPKLPPLRHLKKRRRKAYFLQS